MGSAEHPFSLGWNPERAQVAQSLHATGKTGFQAGTPIPPALSLTGFRKRVLEQGNAGTCWLHSGVRNCELLTVAAGLNYFPVSRMLAGWEGKKLEGGGNPTNGGSASDALAGMFASPGGAGVGDETLWPYSDNSRALGQAPSAAVLAAAKTHWLTSIAKVASNADAMQNIARYHPNSNGIWWPYGWDDPSTAQDGCLFTGWGAGTYGHALVEVGYVQKSVWPGDLGSYDWFQLDNWHGNLYKPLPANLAALVPGYQPTTPTATADFWVRSDYYDKLIGTADAERVTAAGPSGWNQMVDPLTLASALGRF
jgi:hypothetical protein